MVPAPGACLVGASHDSDAVDVAADFEPFDDATNYYGEQDCAEDFDDDGLSAWYFDQA